MFLSYVSILQRYDEKFNSYDPSPAILDLASLLKMLKGDKMSPGRFSLYMY